MQTLFTIVTRTSPSHLAVGARTLVGADALFVVCMSVRLMRCMRDVAAGATQHLCGLHCALCGGVAVGSLVSLR